MARHFNWWGRLSFDSPTPSTLLPRAQERTGSSLAAIKKYVGTK
jgi:hypothetical protein